MCNWISVKDRLPDRGGDYLVYFIPDIFWERPHPSLNGYVDIKQFDILRNCPYFLAAAGRNAHRHCML